jgi:hypothetical protein
MRLTDPPAFAGGAMMGKGSAYPVRDYVWDVRQWADLHAAAFLDHERTPSMVIKMLGMQLQGPAKEWYRQLVEKDPWDAALHSVEHWLVAIKEKFTDRNQNLQTLARFANLRQQQGHEGLRDYIAAFNECIAILGKENDPNVKWEFVRGLLPKASERAMWWGYLQPDRTLADVQLMLERFELHVLEIRSYTHPAYQAQTYGRQGGYNRNGAGPMELGGTWMSPDEGPSGYGEPRGDRRGEGGSRYGSNQGPRPPLDPEQRRRQKLFREGRCYRCEKAGHREADCPQPPPPSESGQNAAPGNGPGAQP